MNPGSEAWTPKHLSRTHWLKSKSQSMILKLGVGKQCIHTARYFQDSRGYAPVKVPEDWTDGRALCKINEVIKDVHPGCLILLVKSFFHSIPWRQMNDITIPPHGDCGYNNLAWNGPQERYMKPPWKSIDFQSIRAFHKVSLQLKAPSQTRVPAKS